ncbi:hypothetical protein OG883_43720 [Streptomyces sp. NBC_01142]|uniref:hypothetical protein n=1 Tax=Streptomyces sp. NBC_01142 TaxID=2975865 RepID=UPI00225C0327|nr:hypothetical protein [Streptomyces sp. NBC_01142]MCX4826550.1 hypothetical protein [Streptomyces sp. NBC_01142]
MLLTPAPSPAALVPLVGTTDFDAELARLLDTLDASQLNDIEIACVRRQSAHYADKLVTALRHRTREVVANKETDSRWPVVAVALDTWEWENGWFWCEYSAELRHLDGTVSTVDLAFDDVSELLADLAGTDQPLNGDTLTVDLLTGDVTQ